MYVSFFMYLIIYLTLYEASENHFKPLRTVRDSEIMRKTTLLVHYGYISSKYFSIATIVLTNLSSSKKSSPNFV